MFTTEIYALNPLSVCDHTWKSHLLMENLQSCTYNVSWNTIPQCLGKFNWNTSLYSHNPAGYKHKFWHQLAHPSQPAGGPFSLHPAKPFFDTVPKPLSLLNFQLAASAENIKFWLCMGSLWPLSEKHTSVACMSCPPPGQFSKQQTLKREIIARRGNTWPLLLGVLFSAKLRNPSNLFIHK